LIIYDGNISDVNIVVQDFNRMRPQLQFTLQLENNTTLIYIDLTISRSDKELEFGIYRISVYTEAIIPFNSCHPLDHIFAALRFLSSRLKTYQLKNEANKNTFKTVCIILFQSIWSVSF